MFRDPEAAAPSSPRPPPSPRPFVKWAGGKARLLPEILSRIPAEVGTYYEPFVGGGAVFFGRVAAAGAAGAPAVLSDANEELVNLYRVVRDDPEGLGRALGAHRYEEAHYYAVRDGRVPEDPVLRAARVLYLNKTCFNGLYRVNRRGAFNVPFGRYEDPVIHDAANIAACSRALAGVRLFAAGFETVASDARRGDFVYFDPPYVPLSATSSFTGYAPGGFGDAEQVRLRDLCARLDGRGVRWIVSNSSAPRVAELYSAYRVETVRAPRFVNSKGSGRGAVDESLIRNY